MIDTILVYDVGTSSVKKALCSYDGKIVSSISVPYTTLYHRPGWAEQDPHSFFESTVIGTRKIVNEVDFSKYSINIISLSGHMNGMLAVDDTGEPTYPELIHCDTRSVQEVAFIKSIHSQQEVYALTGNRIDEFLSLPKLLWLKNNKPNSFRKTRFVINAKDYIRSRLTGIIGTTDLSDASLTGALDIKEKRWGTSYLSSVGISSSLFPTIHSSTDIEGYLTDESAKLLHLPSGIPVCYGGGDAAMATRGALLKDYSSAYLSIGSSAWISKLHNNVIDDKKMRMQHFYDLDGKNMNICGTVQSAGASLEWAKNNFLPNKSFKEIERELAKIPFNKHILALPFFMGERTPHWDAFARGSFMGASMSTTAHEMALSLYEGVAFGLYEIKEVYDELSLPIQSFALLGGGVKSEFFCELIASVFNMPMVIHPHHQNATSFGAALCAMVGSEYYSSLEVAISMTQLESKIIEPDENNHTMYKKYFSIYKKMYQALKPLFSELYDIQTHFEEDFS